VFSRTYVSCKLEKLGFSPVYKITLLYLIKSFEQEEVCEMFCPLNANFTTSLGKRLHLQAIFTILLNCWIVCGCRN